MTRNSLKFLFLATAAVSLTACGASTGGFASAMAQKAVSEAVASKMAADEPVVTEINTSTTTVMTPSETSLLVDADLSPECQKIATKMTETNARITSANEVIGSGQGIGGQAAAAAASQAAVHGGAAQVISKVPFGGLFAKAAMDSVANSGKKKVAKAQKDLEKATLERAKLEGIYAGKGC